MPDRLAVDPRGSLGIASIMARKRADPAAIGAILGIDIPAGAAATFANGRTLIGTGPDTWLVIDEDASADFAHILEQKLGGLASISDQSSGYSILRLSGANARTLLQRGAAIDLHPSTFQPGSAATSVIAHIGVIFWQIDDRPTYDLATFRSFGPSFRHWLEQTAAALPA